MGTRPFSGGGSEKTRENETCFPEYDAGWSAHSSLLLAVAGAYYLHADVRRLLGYEGQVPQPVLASVFPDYAEEGLLDPVLANWAR